MRRISASVSNGISERRRGAPAGVRGRHARGEVLRDGRAIERDVARELPHPPMARLVARVSLEERSQVRERGAVDRVEHALAERRERDQAEDVAPEALDQRDDGEDADQRDGHAVAHEELRLLHAREVGRHARRDRIEHRRELPRGQARLPRLDRRRAPERARGDVAAVDEAAVAGDAVQDERALVVVLGQQLVKRVLGAHRALPGSGE